MAAATTPAVMDAKSAAAAATPQQLSNGAASATATAATSAAAATASSSATATNTTPAALQLEPFAVARLQWPDAGNHILGQYDAATDSIVVYQAFNHAIGSYAAKHQRFTGCPEYSPTRMTWIKSNFCWMQFRSGWGSKPNQEVCLAIWLKRAAFERYCGLAVYSSYTHHMEMTKVEYEKDSARKHNAARDPKKNAELVRLQWDPDHHPSGSPHPRRRAIQLGLKNVLTFASGADILCIRDISDFVRAQAPHAVNTAAAVEKLIVPTERVFTPRDASVGKHLQLSNDTAPAKSASAASDEKPTNATATATVAAAILTPTAAAAASTAAASTTPVASTASAATATGASAKK